jgi:ankyrin repeat protein
MRLIRFGKWTVISLLSVTGLLAAGLSSRIADLAEAGDKAGVQALLKSKGTDVNAPQVDGMTALHWAAHKGDLQTAELLVRAGANVKAVNRYGVTPLSSAAENGNGPMVELFLKAGADPNTVLAGGETVLMTAARTGDVETVGSLIAHGADVNAREARSSQSALMWAAAEGNAQAVEALLKAGADFKTRDRFGFSPLLFAAREGKAAVLPALLKAGEDPNEVVQPKFRQRSHGIAQANRGVAGISAPGTSALAFAVVNGHFEMAQKLLEAGANPNVTGGPGWAPLHAITWVRKSGLGDNSPPPEGSGTMTSLEMVKSLLDHGADINIRMAKNVNVGLTILNTKGATPFFLAARTADAELMRYLAKLGADPLLTNEDNSTPLMAAAGLGTRSPGEDAGTESEVIEAMQVALDLGADINAVDNNGETAMHGAVYKNLPGAVQFVADKGAKIEIWSQKNKQGWTPLWIAQGHRFGNFKPSPETEAVLRKLMTAAGVSTEMDGLSNCDTHSKEVCKPAQ